MLLNRLLLQCQQGLQQHNQVAMSTVDKYGIKTDAIVWAESFH